MSVSDFNTILGMLGRLTDEQRQEVRATLDRIESDRLAISVAEGPPGHRPTCPHCESPEAAPWGHAHGFHRYRCRVCGKTFNRLTGTPMARLRRKDAWLDYAEAMADGLSVRRAAEAALVDIKTAFRWRHRFLAMPAWDFPASLEGIVEADETFFLESFKGRRLLPRPARKRGGVAKQRGLSREQIPVLTIRDRSGMTVDQVISGIGAKQIGPVLLPVLPKDAILCSDGSRAYKVLAAKHHLAHQSVCSKGADRVKGVFHIQNVNGYHSRLKTWMRRFNGVATAYLQNYLGWRRMLDRHGRLAPNLILLAALGRLNNT
jgi:transposase-like protein